MRSSFFSTSALFLYLSSGTQADIAPFYDSEAYAAGLYGSYPRQAYLSDDSVAGPVAHVLVPPQPGLSPSQYIGWAPGGPDLPRTQPMLVDAHSFATVWTGPAMGSQTMGPTVQFCNNTQYLTWWSGEEYDGYKQGSYFIMNSKYELVHQIDAVGNLRSADAHEIYLTPNCTAIITAYAPEPHDLSFYNITNGYIIDSYFQEIDIATEQLLFQWKASAHMDIIKELDGRLPLLDQGSTVETAHDWAHINSVQKDHFGNYLVSGRHAFAIYYISGFTGDIIWRLGGPMNDFKDMSNGKATDFAFQHHARWLDDSLVRLSLFDDRSAQDHMNAEPRSRGIILRLDYDKKEVYLEHEYYATNGIEATREGSMQVLQDSPEPGNVLLGYGEDPAFTEFSQNGTVLLDVTFGPLHLNRASADNYRTLKVNWTGTPMWAPRIAAGPRAAYAFDEESGMFHIRTVDRNGTALANDTAYFSWNGATEIASWAILASNHSINLTFSEHFHAEIRKHGFEDHAFVGSETHFVAAVAIDEHDNVLGATDVLSMTSPARYAGPVGPHGNATDKLTCAWQAFVATHTAASEFGRWHSQLHQIRPDTYRRTMMGRFAPVLIGLAMLIALVLSTMRISVCLHNGRKVWGLRNRRRHRYHGIGTEMASLKGLREDEEDSDSEDTYCDDEEKGAGSPSVRSVGSSSTL